MKIAIGSDHAGFYMKEFLRNALKSRGIDVLDMGAHNPSPSHYPDFAIEVARKVSLNEADFGILICGTGIGMSIVANKFKKIRAALCMSAKFAELSRKHNDANVLCLSGKFLDFSTALEIVNTFLNTNFEGNEAHGERHLIRIGKIIHGSECNKDDDAETGK